jgi:hypothetical protein
MDFEREEDRHRYRLCRAGFALIALGLGLLFVDSALSVAFLLTFERGILELLKNPLWNWLVGGPITWGTVIGAYLLWGRSTDPTWQRRAGLLVIMNGLDLINWTLEHNDALGLRLGPLGHDWLRHQVSSGMGWAEFLLFGSIAVDMLARLQKTSSPETGMAARSLAKIGLVFWAIAFVAQTNWEKGWPLDHKPIPPSVGILISFGSVLLTAVTSFLVAALCASASRECGRALTQMKQEDLSTDLLRSRSETSADEPDRRFTNDHDPWR